MSNVLEYKGYHTKVQYDADSNSLHGKIEGIKDFVNFETENIADVENEFHEAVDDYLALCEEIGKSPDKEFRGTFNVRINPALHRELALEADKRELSMNQLVEKAIDCYLHNKTIPASTIKCCY
jgi:predicted HicB family RNase H-like nuclease